MGVQKIMTGERYGRLTVLDEFIRCSNHQSKWKCRCDCGNIVYVRRPDLVNGKTISCGCYNRENSKKRHVKHLQCTTRLYYIWGGMMSRCTNPNNKNYYLYGGRGIKVCEDWQDSTRFMEWARANGYTDELTLDRIDFNGNYEPSNCRWVDWKTQANNKANNIFFDYKGEKKTIGQISDMTGLAYDLLYNRIRAGWTIEEATTIPKGVRRNEFTKAN